MAECNSIDQLLNQLQTSNNNRFAAMQARIDQLEATQRQCCDGMNDTRRLAEEAVRVTGDLVILVGTLTSQLAGVAVRVVQVASGLATIAVLGARIDAVEAGQNQQATDLSTLFSRLTALKSLVEAEVSAARQCCQENKNDLNDIRIIASTTFRAINEGIAQIVNEIRGKRCPDPCQPIDYDRIGRSLRCPPPLAIDYDRIARSLRCPDPCQSIDYDRIGRSLQCPPPPPIFYTPPPIVFNPIINQPPPICNPPPIIFRPIINPPPPPPIVFRPIINPAPVTCPPRPDPTVSRTLTISACGVTSSRSYTSLASQEPYTATNAAVGLLGEILGQILCKLDQDFTGDLVTEVCPSPTAPPGAPNPNNQSPVDIIVENIVDFLIGELIFQVLSNLIPGPVDDALWRNLLRSYFITRGTGFIKDQILGIVPDDQLFPAGLNSTPQAIRPGDSTPVLAFLDPQNKTRMRYTGKGLAGINNQIEALSEQLNAIAITLCEPTIVQPLPKPDECISVAIIPNDKYIEKTLESQLVLQYVPAGTTALTPLTSKWFIHVPNPVSNLTWSNFNNLDYRRGRIPARIWWDNGKMWTGSNFVDAATADTILLRIAALSTDILKYPEPRKTLDGSPKQQPGEIDVILWSVTIATIQNGRVTGTRCIKRPN